MSRRLRRHMDFYAGVLSTVSVIMVFFISPLLWFDMKDNACVTVFIIGFIIGYIAVCLWEYKPKKEQRRRVRKEYSEE